MAISFINKVFTFLPKTLTSDDTQKDQEIKSWVDLWEKS